MTALSVYTKKRDEAEIELISAFAAAKKPIFGICRGHQILNVALGGTLIQHIGNELAAYHSSKYGKGGDRVHPIRALEGSILAGLYETVFPVNSAHHQAVGKLGRGLFATAWSESGIIEAVEHKALPIVSVQFHPERMAHGHARPDTVDGEKLFEHFIKLCEK